MNRDLFLEELKKLKINLTENQERQLTKYYKLLIEQNKKINLTGITQKKEVYLKHFYDSLTAAPFIIEKKVKLCDIGSGAGFPGVVLKIVYPELEVVLVDSLEKRTKFLEELITELSLENIKVVNERIETYAKEHIEEFDIVTSRAVAKTSILLEMGVQLLKVKGSFILLKANVEQELLESENAIKKLNLKLEEIKRFELPVENSERTILKIIKMNKTSMKYPREFAKMKHRPL